jgi:cell division transport system permease protein
MPKKNHPLTESIEDIPISQEGSRPFLPWIMGLFTLFLVVVLACTLSMGGTFLRWNHQLTNKFTIEIPNVTVVSPEDQHPQQDLTQAHPNPLPTMLQSVMDVLKTYPSIVKAEVVEQDHLLNLVKPLIGNVELLGDLQLPILVDMETLSSADFPLDDLRQKLKPISDLIRVEPHARWQQTLYTFGKAIRTLSYAMMAFIVAMIFVVVGFVTRSAVSAYESQINVLRLMGAKNSYIAGHFQRHTFMHCLKGGGVGALLALPIVYSLSVFAKTLGLTDLFKDIISAELLILCAALPVCLAILSLVVSRITVVRTLAHLEH